jgi:hypothetical protein
MGNGPSRAAVQLATSFCSAYLPYLSTQTTLIIKLDTTEWVKIHTLTVKYKQILKY